MIVEVEYDAGLMLIEQRKEFTAVAHGVRAHDRAERDGVLVDSRVFVLGEHFGDSVRF